MLDSNVRSEPDNTRFRLLVPVWGKRYIDGFCEIALPALLADGNLPALIDYAECEVIFLTTRDSVDVFNTSIGVAKLGKICAYSFVFIDDLLPFVDYGIILTTAYGRGIASMADQQLSTYFIFMNADFVLSNGTLRSVVDRIGRGFRAVMAPSLRCVEENVVGELRERVTASTGCLDATPAELVQLTLDNLHPTAAASIINKPVMHHTGANQFFWQVDNYTLIGRYFLLFMLCIRPERLFDVPTGWCDYAFMPDLVPSHNFDVLTDSDDGFILEMQALRGDSHHVRVGRVSPEYYRPRLSFWSTDNHRKYASSTIVFHSRNLPENYENVKSESDKFMENLLSNLRPAAVSHRDHPFWVSAVRHHQKRLGMHAMPPEFIHEIKIIPKQFYVGKRFIAAAALLVSRFSNLAMNVIKIRLIGRAPEVGLLHYAFLDFKNFRQQVSSFCSERDAILHIEGKVSPFERYVDHTVLQQKITADSLLSCDSEVLSGGSPNGVIISLSDEQIDSLPDILLALGYHNIGRVPVLICANGVQGAFFDARFTLAGDLAQVVALRLNGNVAVSNFLMVGHRERLSIDYRVRKSFQLLLAKGAIVRIAVSAVVLASFAKLLYINIIKRPHHIIADDDVCTSATVVLEADWQYIACSARSKY